MLSFVKNYKIKSDQSKIHSLTRYKKVNKTSTKVTSDHNIMFAKFDIKYSKNITNTKKTTFNFNCEISKKKFLYETSMIKDLVPVLETMETFFKTQRDSIKYSRKPSSSASKK